MSYFSYSLQNSALQKIISRDN
eukprot:Gb_08041 [translate_table: standard]